MPAEPDASQREQVQFRLLVDSVQDYAIFMVDPDGHVASWNLGAERILGYTTEEILGAHVSRFHDAEGRAAKRPERELEVARAVGRFEEETWRVRKDGSRFWANVVITPIHHAGVFVGFA
ncbi:MAG TPA: PAS domain S-box protein, partial [Polyangiaceae bacterium]